MKRRIFVLILVTMIVGACVPVSATQNPVSAPNLQATLDVIIKTSIAQTLTAQPTTPTTAPAIETKVSVVTSSPTAAISQTPSSTIVTNLTTTPATATSGTEQPTSQPTTTGTQLTPSAGTVTLTPTLGILTYGTLPPAVPSASIMIWNKSKVQAYISLQNFTKGKEPAILEYPVAKQVKVKAPLGNYVYVVWVGGRQITGSFVLHTGDDLIITIYKDKVAIQ